MAISFIGGGNWSSWKTIINSHLAIGRNQTSQTLEVVNIDPTVTPHTKHSIVVVNI